MKMSPELKESMEYIINAGKCRCNINIVCLFCDFQPYCSALRETYKLAKEYLSEEEEENEEDR